MSIPYKPIPSDTPLRAYIVLRQQLNRAMAQAERGGWEDALAAVDEARLILSKLERFARARKASKPQEATCA